MDIPDNVLVVGRAEAIDIPALGLWKVPAKIDTGAYGCSVHCFSAQTRRLADGKEILDVQVYQSTPSVIFDEFEKHVVKSSNGDSEERFAVKIVVKLGKKRVRTLVSFADREDMRYSVLIGRKFLRGRFWVDVSRKFVLTTAV
ncbi:MAG: peptidase [Cytophagales bacterium]|nr:MAG: peptidase [Cytophagales bacterium]TAF60691.1 MAG: peptidase [Cytophagales bacterium]